MTHDSKKDAAVPSKFARSVATGLRQAAKAARDQARRHGTMLYGAVDGRVVARSPWQGAIVGWVLFNPDTGTYAGGLIEESNATWRGRRIRDVKKNIRDAARLLHSTRPCIWQFVQLVPIDPRS